MDNISTLLRHLAGARQAYEQGCEIIEDALTQPSKAMAEMHAVGPRTKPSLTYLRDQVLRSLGRLQTLAPELLERFDPDNAAVWFPFSEWFPIIESLSPLQQQFEDFVNWLSRLDEDALRALRQHWESFVTNQKAWLTDLEVRIHAKGADTKTDSRKKVRAVVPQNPDVAKLALKIRRQRDTGANMTDIAREFTNGEEKRAQSLLRKLRAFPRLLD